MTFETKTSILDIRNLPKIAPSEGTPRRSAVLVVIAGSQAGRMFKMDQDALVVGRGTDVALRIEDDGVSRNHARIARGTDGSISISDLGSTNGTFCNGERVTERRLEDGDKIQIGTTTILKFSYQDAIEEEFQKRQYESVTRDALTGCFNKKYFLERLPSELSFAQRHGRALALAMLDIDHFKNINDTYGHPAGDQVLRTFADIVKHQIRTDDVFCRYGGEEFALVMRETAIDPALLVAERVRRKVDATPFRFENTMIKVTVSIGVAIHQSHSLLTADTLIKAADTCLYQAKNGGRNRTESTNA